MIYSRNNTKDAIIDFISGSLGGIALVYVGQPLDTIKVKMQTFPHLHNNMMECFRQTLKNEGIMRGLYAGTVPALIANVAENSVLFAAYGFCQKTIAFLTHTEKLDQLSSLSNATAGFFAAFFSTIALCPTELIKCKLQAMNEVQKNNGENLVKMGPFQLTRNIIHQEGISGLFKGFTSTIVREMPGYFAFFGGYEGTRVLLTPPGKSKEDLGPFKTMAAGAVGGVAFWTAIYPADVAKSRIQTHGSKISMFQLLLHIFKTEGIGGLYNGLQPTLVRTVPATAVLFLVYEYTRKALHILCS